MMKTISSLRLLRKIRKEGLEMNGFGKVLLTLFLIVYIVSPIDAMPGPIDDAVVLLLGLAMRKKLSDDDYGGF